ncbi:BRCA1-associated protein 2-domain-containing protein [Irpex rosettiformis]|uniref:BRCA1-associated protein 2-domain-containing protein n=1 Tax=Irpex rosettiformis TaxID=378272 RepID=A0ACB8TQY2_9APHY|nr:BRCA1-associated protein 2-domain-containing protein [Irpex rosettiformis]
MPGGYHIRINLTNPTLTQVPPESSSFKQTSISPLSHNSTLAFTPTSLFESLPAHPRKQTARRYTIHHHSQFAPEEEASRAGKGSDSNTPPTHCDQKDYRFGPLRIDWVDFDTMDLDSAKKGAVGKEKETAKRGGPAIASFSTTTRSKSGTANLPEGIVHIYRELPHQTYSSVVSTSHPPILPPIAQSGGNDKKKAESDGVLMAVLAVPSWMTPADFLAFVAPAAEGMAHLRMIRDSTPNRSMVVVKFRNASDAAEFAEAYNGKQFNSMESEICHVVRVLSVEIETDDNVSQAIARIGEAESDTYELPTCPVCLERMDSAVTGLVTVPCSHTFHCTCLSKWGDSRCPVCRYSQTLMSSHPTSANTSRSNVPIPFTSPTSTSYCSACPPPSPSSLSSSASSSNLWICLICGNIGCGRYRRAHAHAHYEQTTHLYALELETQRVWDYAGDGYVHRLIQNKADGKLVELPSAASSMTMGGSNRDINGGGGGPSAADALSAEKIEAIGIEYSYLLTSQLDSQRAYYETQTNELKIQVDELKEIVGKLGEEVEAKMVRMKEQEEARRKVEEERVGEIERARVKAEKRAEKFVEVARALEKELKAERAQSEGLLKNLTAAKAKAEKAEEVKESLRAKVTELEEQVRDVMFFVEARDKIEQGEGVVGEAAATNGKKKKGKKG